MSLGELASEVWAVTGLVSPAICAAAVVAPAILAFLLHAVYQVASACSFF